MVRALAILRPVALLALIALLGSRAHAGELFVPGDFPTIQQALDASASEDVIHVAAGTWPGALLMPLHSINILGAGADLTVVDGLGAPATLTTGAVALAKLTDLTLTGGVLGADATPGQLNLTRCTLRGNASHGGQGNISAIDCSFLDNGGHGLSAFISVSGCTFQGNAGWGAEDVSGLYGPTVAGCSFLGNGLGGLRLAAASPSPIFLPALNVTTSVFDGDKLQVSTNVPGENGTSTVTRCTFHAAGIKLMQGHLSLDHSIVRADPAIQDFASGGTAFGNFSDVQGGIIGFANIDADPLWADPDHGDFALLPGSPCINAGNPGWFADPDGSAPDMGAIAYHPWTELGGGVAGTAGQSRLSGDGPLVADDDLSLQLTDALPGAAAWLFVGLSEAGVPFKGGTLWPSVDVVLGPIGVSVDGQLTLNGTWPAGLPAGFGVWSQSVWADAGAVQGWALSNGLRGVQP